MQEKINRYKAYLKRKQAYDHAMGVLFYDSDTVMPRGGAEGLSETMGILSEELYKMETDSSLRELIGELYENRTSLDPITRRELEVHMESIARIECIPTGDYVEYQKLRSLSSVVWEKAKQENDYASFRPILEKMLAYTKSFALAYAPEKDPYDTMLDEYEKGLTQSGLNPFFEQISTAFRPMVEEASRRRNEIDDSFLFLHYPVPLQRVLSDEIMQVMCIDRNYCNIGEVEHPFTTNFSKHDVRITTHYYEDNLASSFYSVVHEGGHALYELHTDDTLLNSPLGTGVSMGIHESQSRLFENIIGRSEGFINVIFPTLTRLFPEQLKGVTPHMFFRAVNKSIPSLIRTEADELTYCFHIMIRYELEKQLVSGTLTTTDLPEAWNQMYRDSFGILVPDDTHGVLQDSHWSYGNFGYFPSYAIGSAYGAQFMAAMQRSFDAEAAVQNGNLEPITAWLTENIWKYGMMKTPGKLLEDACGEPFRPEYYIRYMKAKIRSVYGE